MSALLLLAPPTGQDRVPSPVFPNALPNGLPPTEIFPRNLPSERFVAIWVKFVDDLGNPIQGLQDSDERGLTCFHHLAEPDSTTFQLWGVPPQDIVVERGAYGESVEVPFENRYISRPTCESTFPKGATRHGVVVQLPRVTSLRGKLDVQLPASAKEKWITQIGWLSSPIDLKPNGSFECRSPRNTRSVLAVWLDDACAFLPITVPDNESEDVGILRVSIPERSVILNLEVDKRNIPVQAGYVPQYYGIVLVRDDLAVGYVLHLGIAGSGIVDTHRLQPDRSEAQPVVAPGKYYMVAVLGNSYNMTSPYAPLVEALASGENIDHLMLPVLIAPEGAKEPVSVMVDYRDITKKIDEAFPNWVPRPAPTPDGK